MNKDTLYSYWSWNSKTSQEWWTPFWFCPVLPAFFLNCLLFLCPTPRHGLSVILVLTCQPRGLKLLNPLQRSHLTCSQLQSPCKVPAAVTKQYSTPPICTLAVPSWANYPLHHRHTQTDTHTHRHTHTHTLFSRLLAKGMVDSGRRITNSALISSGQVQNSCECFVCTLGRMERELVGNWLIHLDCSIFLKDVQIKRDEISFIHTVIYTEFHKPHHIQTPVDSTWGILNQCWNITEQTRSVSMAVGFWAQLQGLAVNGRCFSPEDRALCLEHCYRTSQKIQCKLPEKYSACS